MQFLPIPTIYIHSAAMGTRIQVAYGLRPEFDNSCRFLFAVQQFRLGRYDC